MGILSYHSRLHFPPFIVGIEFFSFLSESLPLDSRWFERAKDVKKKKKVIVITRVCAWYCRKVIKIIWISKRTILCSLVFFHSNQFKKYQRWRRRPWSFSCLCCFSCLLWARRLQGLAAPFAGEGIHRYVLLHTTLFSLFPSYQLTKQILRPSARWRVGQSRGQKSRWSPMSGSLQQKRQNMQLR